MLLYDIVDIKARCIMTEKVEHFILIKWSTEQKITVTLNLYIQNNVASKYIKQNLTVLKRNQTYIYIYLATDEVLRIECWTGKQSLALKESTA